MYINSNTRFLNIAILPLVAALSVACSTTPPSIDTSEDAEISFDGLHKVLNSKADAAWALPGMDLSGYTKIKLVGAGVEYRPGGEKARTAVARSRGGPYEVTDAQKVRFEKAVTDAFRSELAKSERFELVEETGPDVLLINGALLDVVSYVPSQDTTARVDVYLSSVGDATLVLEIRDSITNAIFARIIDRRAAGDISGTVGSMPSSRASNSSDVKRMVRRWARALREALETAVE
jgi:hypothetical protein